MVNPAAAVEDGHEDEDDIGMEVLLAVDVDDDGALW